jgi:hypothetical protein
MISEPLNPVRSLRNFKIICCLKEPTGYQDSQTSHSLGLGYLVYS